jgi:UPF0716 protein FxsA
VELALLIQVGTLIGGWATLGLIVVAAVAGVLVLRREGTGAVGDLRAAQQSMLARMSPGTSPSAAGGRTVDPSGALLGAPSRSPSERLLVILAGVLLLVPGFLTDVAGLLLLVPPVRGGVRRSFSAAARRRGWVTPGQRARTVTAEPGSAPSPTVVGDNGAEVVDVRVIEVRGIEPDRRHE